MEAFLEGVEDRLVHDMGEILILTEDYLMPSYNFLNKKLELFIKKEMNNEKKLIVIALVAFIMALCVCYFV